MRLVDHRVAPRYTRRDVVAGPRHAGLGHDGPRQRRRRVVRVTDQLAGGGELVPPQAVMPAHRAIDEAGVGVEQQLGGIEQVAGFGHERPVGAQPIPSAGTGARHVGVPDAFLLAGHDDTGGLTIGRPQLEHEPGRVRGPDPESGACPIPRSPEGPGHGGKTGTVKEVGEGLGHGDGWGTSWTLTRRRT